MKHDCCTTKETAGVAVSVNVEVSKIIKYLSLAAVLIVGIIFASKCIIKLLSKEA